MPWPMSSRTWLERIAAGSARAARLPGTDGATVDGHAICQFVPDSEEYDSHAALMFDVLTRLAEFENRQAPDVIDDILREAANRQPNGATSPSNLDAEVTGK